MIYLKENKKNIVKEYKKFANDMKLIKSVNSFEWFSREYISNEIKLNGVFSNKKFKTYNLSDISNEIVDVLKNNFK